MIVRKECGLYDSISDLPIMGMTKEFFNEMNNTEDEIYLMMMQLENNIKYFVKHDKTVTCMYKESLLKCVGDYYYNYDDIPKRFRS